MIKSANTVVFGTSIHTHSLLFWSFITMPLFPLFSNMVTFAGNAFPGLVSSVFNIF